MRYFFSGCVLCKCESLCFQVLRVLVQGVEGVSLSAGPGAEGVSAIVTFSSHQAASMAKRTLVEGR